MAQGAAKTIAYCWEGKDKNGNVVTGDVQSQSETLAKAELRRRGINVQKIKKKSGSLKKGKITPKDMDNYRQVFRDAKQANHAATRC